MGPTGISSAALCLVFVLESEAWGLYPVVRAEVDSTSTSWRTRPEMWPWGTGSKRCDGSLCLRGRELSRGVRCLNWVTKSFVIMLHKKKHKILRYISYTWGTKSFVKIPYEKYHNFLFRQNFLSQQKPPNSRLGNSSPNLTIREYTLGDKTLRYIPYTFGDKILLSRNLFCSSRSLISWLGNLIFANFLRHQVHIPKWFCHGLPWVFLNLERSFDKTIEKKNERGKTRQRMASPTRRAGEI